MPRPWIFASILLVSLASPARGTTVEVGFHAGVNLSRFTQTGEDHGFRFESRSGTQFGVRAKLNVHPRVAIHLGPRWLQSGTQEEKHSPGTDIETSYVSVPILVSFAMNTSEVSPYFLGGLDLGFLSEATRRDNTGTTTITEVFEDLSLVLELGLGASRRVEQITFFAEGVYRHGLNNLSAPSTQTLALGQGLDLAVRGFSLNLGILYRLGSQN